MHYVQVSKMTGYLKEFNWGIIIIIALVSLFSFPLAGHASDPAPRENPDPPLHFPPLLQSIRFAETIELCNVKIPLHRQDVKERLEKEMLLSLWNRPQVILWMKRASRYFPHVESILKAHKLPLDLKYVPIVESALRAHSASSKGAVGYWQFIRSTGKQYGLRIDSKVDERRNIFASTQAASLYLKVLEKKFDSYLLALAAYNMGEYGLQKEMAVQQNSDFFSLYLPLETQRYVFKLICVKLIFENPESYGFSFKKTDFYPALTFDRVNLTSDFSTPITLIAKAAEVPFKTIKDMNPELRGYYLDKGKYTLLIPRGKARKFKQNFTIAHKNWTPPKKKNKAGFHVVKKGESLGGIAQKYEMSLSSLLKLNHLSSKGVIHPGDRLVIK